MELEHQEERKQAHAPLDQLPPAKLGAVRSLLEVMLDDGEDEELTEEDRRAIQVGLDSLEEHRTVSMEEVVANFGLRPKSQIHGGEGEDRVGGEKKKKIDGRGRLMEGRPKSAL